MRVSVLNGWALESWPEKETRLTEARGVPVTAKVCVDVEVSGVYVSQLGRTGLRAMGKEEAADEQGASTLMAGGMDETGYEKVFSAKVIREPRPVRVAVIGVEDEVLVLSRNVEELKTRVEGVLV